MHGRLSGRSFNDFSKCASILAQTHILTFQCNRENDLKNIKYFLCPLQQSTLKSHQWIKKDQENKSAQEGGTRRRTIEGTRGETGEIGNEKGGKEKRKAIRLFKPDFLVVIQIKYIEIIHLWKRDHFCYNRNEAAVSFSASQLPEIFSFQPLFVWYIL